MNIQIKITNYVQWRCEKHNIKHIFHKLLLHISVVMFNFMP